MDIIEYIGSIGGIAGILAVLMWLVIRHLLGQMKDTLVQMREDRKFMEDRLTEVIKDYNEACFSTRDALLENTRIQSELYTWLKAKNGH